jgi:hypothetical protein
MMRRTLTARTVLAMAECVNPVNGFWTAQIMIVLVSELEKHATSYLATSPLLRISLSSNC